MKLSLRNRRLRDCPLTIFVLASAFAVPAHGFQADNRAGSDLKQDYDAAQQAQSNGNLPQAATYSKLFIVRALNLLARNYANIGDYGEATALYDEGLLLDPGDSETRLDYVQEAVSAGDLEKATELAQEAVARAPRSARRIWLWGACCC